MLSVTKLRLFAAFFTVLSMCPFQERSELMVAPCTRHVLGIFDCLELLSVDTVGANDRIPLVGNPNHLTLVRIELPLVLS